MKNKATVIPIIIILVVLSIAITLLATSNYEKARSEINDFNSCAAAGYPVGESYPRQCWTPDGKHFFEEIERTDSINEYFNDKLWERAVENQGGLIPIEGFTPDLYMGAFPGLVKEDFNKVNAINGHWELQKNELKFIMASSTQVTSADGTLTQQGTMELLNNLEKRLGMTFETEEQIDELLDLISE